MPNTLTAGLWYDPYTYANEMLDYLKRNLGMAQRVHRGFDKAPNERGSVVQLRRPEVYSAESMPAAAADVVPEYVNVTLAHWWPCFFRCLFHAHIFIVWRATPYRERAGPSAGAIIARHASTPTRS